MGSVHALCQRFSRNKARSLFRRRSLWVAKSQAASCLAADDLPQQNIKVVSPEIRRPIVDLGTPYFVRICLEDDLPYITFYLRDGKVGGGELEMPTALQRR